MFAARCVLGEIPVINLRTSQAGEILEKVGSSRGSKRAYYRMIDWMLWAAPFAFWGFLNRGLF
jgi:hypothetical protein